MFRLELLIYLSTLIVCLGGQVIELNDSSQSTTCVHSDTYPFSFPDIKQQQAWLVKFYAPWCGHCKHLEPVYHQVSLELRSTSVKVARIDATQYPELASTYHVRAFPTIKFIQGDLVVDFLGERSKEVLVNFAKKALRPSVSSISSEQQLQQLQLELSNDVFFLLITGPAPDDDDVHNLSGQFHNASHKFLISNEFFILPPSIQLPPNMQVSSVPTIVAIRDDDYRQISEEFLEGGVEKWVGQERWGWVAKVGGMALNEVNSLGKSLIILVHELQDEYYDMMFGVAKHTKNLYDTHQFVHLTDVEVGNNIIMHHLSTPFFFIFHPSTHHFFLPTSSILSPQHLISFINEAEEGKLSEMGGRGAVQRIKRMLYSITTVIYNTWEESVLVTLLVLAVPLLVVLIVCYTICCIDVGEEVIYEEGEEEEDYEDEDAGEEEEDKKKQ